MNIWVLFPTGPASEFCLYDSTLDIQARDWLDLFTDSSAIVLGPFGPTEDPMYSALQFINLHQAGKILGYIGGPS